MPDVILKDGTKKSFPYTEVGIANAKQFAKTNGVKMVSNYHPPPAPFSKKKKQEERNRNVENLIPKADTDARPRRGTGSLAEKKSLEKEGHGDLGMYGYDYGSKKNGDSSRWGIGTSPRYQYRTKTTPGGSSLFIPETDPVPKKAKKRTYLMADGKLQADAPKVKTSKITQDKKYPWQYKKKKPQKEQSDFRQRMLQEKEKPPSAPKKVKVSKRDKALAEYEIPPVAGFFDDEHPMSKAKPGKERLKEAFKSPGVRIGTAVGTALGGLVGQYAGRYDSLHSPGEKVALKVAGAVPGGMWGGMIGAKAETLVKKGKRWLKVRKRAKEIANKKAEKRKTNETFK